jgi:hypothetical protein
MWIGWRFGVAADAKPLALVDVDSGTRFGNLL